MKFQATPYFTFSGNTRQAMEYYQECFGGTLDIKTFAEMNNPELTEEQQNQVLHATLTSDQLILMASDSLDQKVDFGNQISLSLNFSSEEEIDKIFEKMTPNSTIIMPLEKQFWGAKFGMIKDAFGTQWMFNFDY